MRHRVPDALYPRFHRILVLSVLSSLWSATACQAQEPVQDFLQALRNRGYFDTALEYIAEQEKNPSLSAELKQSLGFERAMTLLQNSRQARTSGAKSKTLAEAQAALEQFAQQFPRHPLAARANSELGNILFERARTAVWQSESPPANTTKEQLRREARTLIAQARGIFQKAFQLYDTQLKAFPAYIDEDDEDMRLRFRKVQGAAIANQLSLARCTYEEGQTYDADSEERRKLLLDASEKFRETHEPYRTWMGGLTARLWQAKCFEELGDVGTALGIYQEVLGHSDEDAGVRDLKALAKRFRLICLNHDKKKDYKLAILEASTWLDSQSKSRTENAIGIRWQKARAHDLFGQTIEPANEEHERQLRLAMNEATEVSRYQTAYKDVAGAMVRRLKTQLGDQDGPPQDFDTAYELARTYTRKIQTLKTAAARATSAADRQKAQEDLKLELLRTDETLTLALRLADDRTEADEILQAQYLLSFVKVQRRRSLDAIVLATHVMEFGAKDHPETALNAAEVAMVACVQAFNDAGADHDYEMQMLEEVSNSIIAEWPESDRANEARMSLGMINHKADRPAEASKWYTAVPKTAKQYAEAQLAAGQTWWQASLAAGRKDNPNPPEPAAIKQMTEAAERHLREGLKASVKPNVRPAPSVTAARLSLAQILNGRSQFADTIKLLTEGNHSVISEVQVPDGQARPAEGVKNEDFASLAYQVLLRAFVGTQQIDEALVTMEAMEKIGGPDAQIYVSLGQQLQDEIERLKTTNDTERLKQLRTSFEQFLSKVFQRKDKQNYGLLIWVAETYRGLGQGMNDDPATAANYFQRAAESYNEILTKGLAGEKRETIVRLRLVNCRRSMRDFEGAMTLLQEILKQHPRDMNAQFEGAYLLSDWGRSGNTDKLTDSIAGYPANSQNKTIWGWIGLGQRLRNPSYRDRFFESQLAMVESRRDYALLGKVSQKQAGLEAALRDVELIVATQGDIDEPWWGRLNTIYKTLQTDLGRPVPEALQKAEQFTATPIVRKDPEPATTEPAEPEPEKAKEKDSGGGTLAFAGALIVALAAAGGMWFTMSKPRKPATAVSKLAEGPPPSFEGVTAAQPRKKKKAPGGQKKRPANSAGERRPSPGGQQKPRVKKPKPPAEDS